MNSRNLLAGIFAGVLLLGCNKAAEAPKTDAPPNLILAAEDLIELTESALASGAVISGSIQPTRRADLRAEVAAVVLQVLKENGEPVRRGDLLVRLDDTAIRDALASADAAVRAAQQTLTQAERQLQRLQTLRASGMASMQQLDDTETRRNNAASDLAAARSRLAQAQQQLLRTEVRAPFDGLVAERKASVGDTAQIGKELLKVIDPASLRFEGSVTADQAGAVRVGQSVSFRVNGEGETDFSGEVTRIGAAANPTTRQIEVLVAFSGKARPRVAGLFAEGRILTGEKAVTVPASSVFREGDTSFVWQVRDGALRKSAVELGPRDARRGDYAVLRGVTAGAKVLRYPALTLKDGQRVEMSGTPAAHTAAN